jgi:WD40 repeat protein
LLLLRERTVSPPHPNNNTLHEDRIVTRISDFAVTADGRYILASYCRVDCQLLLQFEARLFAETTDGDAVRLWEVDGGRLLWEQKVPGPPERVVPSPDNKLFGVVTTWGECEVYIHSLTSGERLVSLPPSWCHDSPPPVVFLPGGDRFITFSTAPSSKKDRRFEHLALYDSRTGRMLHELRSKHGSGNADLSPDGRWLVAHNWTKRGFKLWDLERGSVVGTYFPKIGPLTWWGHIPNLLRFDPGGRWLVAVDSGEGYLAVYKVGP